MDAVLVASAGSAAGGLLLLVFLVIAVGWVLPVYLSARITSNRGRGTTSGVLLGLFLGWLGVLIALMLGQAKVAHR